jgi:hypothetical protein
MQLATPRLETAGVFACVIGTRLDANDVEAHHPRVVAGLGPAIHHLESLNDLAVVLANARTHTRNPLDRSKRIDRRQCPIASFGTLIEDLPASARSVVMAPSSSRG